MSGSIVNCSCCQMWEALESSSLRDHHVCSRCVELQYLRDRVRDLETQLDDLRMVREIEEDIERSYRQVVTPGPRVTEKWVTVRNRKGKSQVLESTPVAVPLDNKYSCLSTVGGDSLPGGSNRDCGSGTESVPVAQKGRDKKRRTLVIGDSIVRGSDRRFCGRQKDTRMVVCLPGARVRDVSDRVQDILEWEGDQPEVVVHVGTNNIGRNSEEVLKREYRELGRKLRSRTTKVVISGLLPVPRDSEYRNRMRWRINVWLRDWSRGQGFRFLDHWDLFWARYDLYKKDGLHLNPRGTNILAGRFARTTGESLN